MFRLRPHLLLVVLLAAVSLVALDTAVCYWAIGRLVASVRLQQEAARTSSSLADLLSTLTNAETGQRGYLLTGNPSYLDPYNRSLNHIDPLLQDLAARLQLPDQQKLLPPLRDAIHAKVLELARTIRVRDNEGFDAARAIVATNAGQEAMDNARSLIAQLQQSQESVLSRQTAASQYTARSAFYTLALVAGGNVALLTLVAVLILASRRRRRRYAENTARLAAIVESSDDAIVGKTLDGIITSWNAGAARMFGYSAEEAIGQGILLIIPPELHAEETRILQSLAAGEPVRHLETVRLTKDGRRIEVSITSSPIRGEDGRIIGASKIARDISQEKRDQRNLLDAYTRLSDVLGSVTDAYIALDDRFNFLEVNPAALRLVFHDRPAHDLLGKNFWELYPAARNTRFYAEYHRAVQQRTPVHFEAHSAIVDRWFETHVYPRTDRLEIYLRDITERKQNEAEIHSLNRDLENRVVERTAELRQVNQHLEAFAYTISHDLRAPLRAMQGFSQALLEDYGPSLDETARSYANRIAAAAARMDLLISDLLEFSRLQRIDLPLSPTPLDAVVDQALQQLEADIRARQARVHIDRPLPSVTAHPRTLVQIVANLISNGIKFVAPEKVPTLTIKALPENGRVRLSVEDNGIGISPQHHERIFRLFERLHGTESYPGTGIGLAIVQRGIERMHGSCGVQSTPGQGSLFWIELPPATSPVRHS
ncbi:MAG: sensor histidine kinase [Phycisphaerae bacterium]